MHQGKQHFKSERRYRKQYDAWDNLVRHNSQRATPAFVLSKTGRPLPYKQLCIPHTVISHRSLPLACSNSCISRFGTSVQLQFQKLRLPRVPCDYLIELAETEFDFLQKGCRKVSKQPDEDSSQPCMMWLMENIKAVLSSEGQSGSQSPPEGR